MSEKAQNISSLSKKWINGWIAKVDLPMLKRIGLSVAVFMFAAHGFAFTNLFPNHDSLLVVSTDQMWQFSLGRWAQPYYLKYIRGPFNAPWLLGILSMLYLTLSVYLIVKMLRLNTAAAIMLSGLMATGITLTCTFARYQNWADIYMLALLLACSGVVLVKHSHGMKWLFFLLGSVCFCFSLGLYQSYIEVAVGLFLLLMLRQILIERVPWKKVYLCGIRYVSSLIIGGGLYLITEKFFLLQYGVQDAENYNGLAQLSNLKIDSILKYIPKAYQNAIETFAGFSKWNTRPMRVANALLLLLALFCIVRFFLMIRWKKDVVWPSTLLLVLLPLGINCVYVLTGGMMHLLMIFSFNLFYVWVFSVLGMSAAKEREVQTESSEIKLTGVAAGILTTILIFSNVVYANGTYLYCKLIYDKTMSQMSYITCDIQKMPGYVAGETPVIMVGDFKGSEVAFKNENYRRFSDAMASNSAITYIDTKVWYYQNIAGTTIRLLSGQEELKADWESDPRVKDMPVYPNNGYCAVLDGTVIVKIS